jgi:hypothetical protein
MRKSAVAAVFAFGLPIVASAQPQSAAGPGPEYQRLDSLVGTWNGAGEQKPNLLGAPVGKYVGTMTCSRFLGGYQVVCSIQATIEKTPFREMAIFGYDAEDKVYTWFDIDSSGMNGLGHGSKQGNAWTFLFDMKAAGKPLKLRAGLVEHSPGVILNKAEVSLDGAPWATLFDARFTKTK